MMIVHSAAGDAGPTAVTVDSQRPRSIRSGKLNVMASGSVEVMWLSSTGSALAATSDIHRRVPMNMADIRRDWLTNQNTDWCFVVIGLSTRQSHSPLLQLKIDPVRQLGPPYWLAASGYQKIFINIRGQYGIQKNIYIHPCFLQFSRKQSANYG